MWSKEASDEKVVSSAWEEGLFLNANFPLIQCLENYHAKLDVWNKDVFGHVGKIIARLHKHLKWLELQAACLENINTMRETRVELNY